MPVVQPGITIDELDTPCLLVDIDRLEANIQHWQAQIRAGGADLRPHVKTHKVPLIAHMQLAAGACGITAAKVAEAEVFAAHGCRDIFIAYPIAGALKWRHAAELARSCTLTVGVDSLACARGLSDAAVAAGTQIRVRVEIEQGLQRSGVGADQVGLLCAEVIRLPGIELDGIFAYRSIFFPGAERMTASEAARNEGEIMVAFANQLRAAGIPIRSISVGSTPTAIAAAAVAGVTEMRPATYFISVFLLVERGVIYYY